MSTKIYSPFCYFGTYKCYPKGLNVPRVTKPVLGSVILFLDFLKLFVNMRLAISFAGVQIL
jgi:hypothetical protein